MLFRSPVPLLCASFHLSRVIGRQRQTLETMTSGHRPRGNEVVRRQTIEGTERTPQTLDSLVNRLSRRIGPVRIVTSATGILDIVMAFEPLEALRLSIVDILGIGDKLGRRRGSVGSRHFKWRTGQWCKMQWLMLLLAAHVRHGLIWSSLPLPWDSYVH